MLCGKYMGLRMPPPEGEGSCYFTLSSKYPLYLTAVREKSTAVFFLQKVLAIIIKTILNDKNSH